MIRIFYFSGTGNTLWSARKIAETIGGDCELHNTGTEAYLETITIEADAVVLLFPSYAYGAPVIVRRFVKKAVFKTPYIACFVTFGTTPGGALAEIARILRPKYRGGCYYGRIPAVENYTAIFGPPKANITGRRLALQREATRAAARAVMARQTNRVQTFRPLSSFVSLLFSLGVKIFYRYYRVAPDCDGCGICEKLCPVAAIVIQNKRPVFSGKCEHCQGCLAWCPRQAVQFWRLVSGVPRYHHPEITQADMARRFPAWRTSGPLA